MFVARGMLSIYVVCYITSAVDFKIFVFGTPALPVHVCLLVISVSPISGDQLSQWGSLAYHHVAEALKLVFDDSLKLGDPAFKSSVYLVNDFTTCICMQLQSVELNDQSLVTNFFHILHTFRVIRSSFKFIAHTNNYVMLHMTDKQNLHYKGHYLLHTTGPCLL